MKLIVPVPCEQENADGFKRRALGWAEVEVQEVPASDAPVVVKHLSPAGERNTPRHEIVDYRSYQGRLYAAASALGFVASRDLIKARPTSKYDIDKALVGFRRERSHPLAPQQPLIWSQYYEARAVETKQDIELNPVLADIRARAARSIMIDGALHIQAAGPTITVQPSRSGDKAFIGWSGSADIDLQHERIRLFPMRARDEVLEIAEASFRVKAVWRDSSEPQVVGPLPDALPDHFDAGVEQLAWRAAWRLRRHPFGLDARTEARCLAGLLDALGDRRPNVRFQDFLVVEDAWPYDHDEIDVRPSDDLYSIIAELCDASIRWKGGAQEQFETSLRMAVFRKEAAARKFAPAMDDRDLDALGMFEAAS